MRLWWSQGRTLLLACLSVDTPSLEFLGLTRLTPSIAFRLALHFLVDGCSYLQHQLRHYYYHKNHPRRAQQPVMSAGSGYDLSSSTFSPDGRIFQVEYASKAVENGGTALGLKCRDGVVLAVEKPVLNKMLLPTSNRRIHSVDEAHGVAVTGFVADARQIVNRARDEAIGYEET